MKSFLNIRNFSGTFLTNLSIQLITLIQGVIIARILGPEGRGGFAAILMWPSFFAGIMVFGTKTGISRIVANLKDYSNVYVSSLFLSSITGVIGFLIAYILLPFLLTDENSELLFLARLYSLVIIINHLAGGLLAIDHGAGNFKSYNFLRAILNPIYLLILGALFLFESITLRSCIIALLIANSIVLVIRLIFASKKLIFKNIYPVRRIFRKSFSFGIADMVLPIYQFIDQAILLWLLGTVNLGLYTVALTAAGILNVISQAVATVTFTQFANNSDSANSVLKVFNLTAICYLLCGIILVILLPYLIPLVYGNEFKPSIYPAIILLFATFFQGQGYILEQSLRGYGKAFVGLEGRLISILVMAGFGFLLSPYGLIGVVSSFVLAQLCFLLIIVYRFNKILNPVELFYPTKKDFLVLYGLIRKNIPVIK